MSTTITSLTGTQLNDGSSKVHVTATVANTAGASVGLVYEFKHVSATAWSPAVTDGPASVVAAVGGTALDFLWDLDASSIDSTTTADFNFRVTAQVNALPAKGSVTAVAANATTGIKDGDKVVIAGQTYEFDTDSTLNTIGAIAVTITASANQAAVQTALYNAIRNNVNAGVTAATGAAGLINLTAATAGAAGNVAITQTMANGGVTLTPVGLAGGADATTNAAQAAITLTGAATGAVPPLPETVTVPTLPNSNTIYVSKYEKAGKVLGSTPVAFFSGAAAYSRLDALRSGKYAKFDYDLQYTEVVNDKTIAEMDKNQNMAVLALPGHPSYDSAGVQLSTARRAVLISVAEFNRVTAGKTVTKTLQPKQWLAYKANKSFVRLFANPNAVYAIYEDTYLPGNKGTLVQTQTVIAYLLSAANYNALQA